MPALEVGDVAGADKDKLPTVFAHIIEEVNVL
jgi:hypothetical protein